jgi:hypothetical protein
VPERNTLLVAAGRCSARGLKGCGNEGGGGRDSAGELLAIDLTIFTGVSNSRAVTIATTRGKRMQVTRHQDSFVTAARHSFETPTIAAKARADPTLEAD